MTYVPSKGPSPGGGGGGGSKLAAVNVAVVVGCVGM